VTIASAIHAERHGAKVEFTPGAQQVLNHLYGEYRLGLITNGGPDTQDPKIDSLGLDRFFEIIVLAGVDTAPKPDSEPFQYALDEMGISSEQAVYVGDSLQHDVAGAHTVGLDSVWIRNGQLDEPDANTPKYVIDSLTELLPPPWK